MQNVIQGIVPIARYSPREGGTQVAVTLGAHHSESEDGGHSHGALVLQLCSSVALGAGCGIVGGDGKASQQHTAGHALHVALRQVLVVGLRQVEQLVPARHERGLRI